MGQLDRLVVDLDDERVRRDVIDRELAQAVALYASVLAVLFASFRGGPYEFLSSEKQIFQAYHVRCNSFLRIVVDSCCRPTISLALSLM